MMVYVAYMTLIAHVILGYMNAWSAGGMDFSTYGFGIIFTMQVSAVIYLQISSAWHTNREMKQQTRDLEEWTSVCLYNEVLDKRAKIFIIGDQNIAIFRDGTNYFAVNNVCRHQNGPLGEGKIIDGCITCPWHGYQYYPHNGQSPPPFTEKLETYQLKQEGDWIYVNPIPNPPGTAVEPLEVDNEQ